MIPREKAKELIEKFSKHSYNKTKDAKQCALIAVNELIAEHRAIHEFSEGVIYWQEVKLEILKNG